MAPKVAQGGLPARISPMLAYATRPFDSAEHLYEIKWDGTRCIALIEKKLLRLENRRFFEMRDRYPELSVLLRLPDRTVLDGEIVVLHDGLPSFAHLQRREHLTDPLKIQVLAQRLPATFIVFDLLYLAGENLTAKPLVERRRRLKDLIDRHPDPHLLVPDYIVGEGRAYFSAVEEMGLEGIMAKRLDSPYLIGRRSRYWLKIKAAQTKVFSVIGFVRQEGEPAIGSLIIGVREAGRWVFKAKVGSGFTEAQRRQLYAELSGAPPLPEPPAAGPSGAVWRQTNRKCRVRYFDTTGTGKLRAPVFAGFME